MTVLLPVAASHFYEHHLRRSCEKGVVGVMELQADSAELYARQVPMVRSVRSHSSSLLRYLLFDNPRWIDPRQPGLINCPD